MPSWSSSITAAFPHPMPRIFLNPVAHQIRVRVVNTEGDVGYAHFLLSEISPHQVAILEDHSSQVNSVVFSPNGRRSCIRGHRTGQ